MIDFLIISKDIEHLFVKNWQRMPISSRLDLCIRNDDYFQHNSSDQELIIIGDCINTDIIDKNQNVDIDFVVNKLKGNFYAIIITREDTIITSSVFGLLPVYYMDDFSVISSSVSIIHKVSSVPLTENKKWLVNQLLFNYQFGDDTYFKEIRLFPTLSYLKVDNNNYKFSRYFDVGKAFVEKPKSWRKSIKNLSNLFIETTEKYIPQKGSVISFTGGFDGRTLVSVATHFKKDFETFSYGKIENDDVSIPLQNSKALNIPYFWLNLDKEYAENEYLKSSIEYIKNTDGANGLLYAHADYSAKKVKEKGAYLLSGACGSELFRAAHSSGAVTSEALINLFKLDIFEDYKKSVLNSDVFRYINKHNFRDEINEVIIQTWNYKINLPSTLLKNQQLYVFIYEEIFRKFFGAWVIAQMKYIKVRTPFIDFNFFKEVIGTELSGAYSDFLTENPLKRFKGQVLYADIIKKTNNAIYNMKTGKGYAPKVVREPILRPLLFLPFLTKRFKRNIKPVNLDNLGIISGIKLHDKELEKQINHQQFNINDLKLELEKLSAFTRGYERDILLASISFLIYRSMLHNRLTK
jgi:hypothetical protein